MRVRTNSRYEVEQEIVRWHSEADSIRIRGKLKNLLKKNFRLLFNLLQRTRFEVFDG